MQPRHVRLDRLHNIQIYSRPGFSRPSLLDVAVCHIVGVYIQTLNSPPYTEEWQEEGRERVGFSFLGFFPFRLEFPFSPSFF